MDGSAWGPIAPQDDDYEEYEEEEDYEEEEEGGVEEVEAGEECGPMAR
jgi:hypothetical protein